MFTAKELNEMSKEAPKYKEAYEEIMEQIVPLAVERAGYGFFDAKLILGAGRSSRSIRRGRADAS